MSTFNIYCDESCHLEHDNSPIMVLGGLWLPQAEYGRVRDAILQIKKDNHISKTMEVKWSKVSPAKQGFYLDLIDYFLDTQEMHFRALVVRDKSKLHHELFDRQTHDTWYYKMYFTMLKAILDPAHKFRIYLDIKDTHGGQGASKLHEVLCNSMYDFSCSIIDRVQVVRSHEVEVMGLTDLLIGSIAYANRDLATNAGKSAAVARLRERTGYSLTRTTLLRELKLNLFFWDALEIRADP